MRFWEFFFGCFIPFIKLKKNNLLSLIFLIIALVIIFLPIHINQNGTIYIIHNILVVLCVSNFLIYYQQNKIYELIFNNKFLVILGNQSYSIYLWHLPIIYFVSIYFNNKTFLILTLILTFSFSFLTYHFVENYFRYRKWDKKFIFKPLGILVSLVIIFIFSNKLFSTSEIRSFVKKNNYLEKNFNWIDRTTFKKMKINDFPVYPNCQKNIREQLYKNEINLKCLKENKSKDLFYLVGNSYIAQHVPMFNQEKKFDFYYEHYDDNLNSNFNKLSVFSKKYNKVYLVKSINNNNEFKKFIETVKNNYNQKINFLAIGPIPNFRNKYLNPLTCLIQKLECEINKIEDLNERNLQNIKDQMILLMQTNTNLYFFDSYDALCPLLKCSVYNNNEDLLMLRDDKHLSYEGSLSISKKFKKFVMEELE